MSRMRTIFVTAMCLALGATEAHAQHPDPLAGPRHGALVAQARAMRIDSLIRLQESRDRQVPVARVYAGAIIHADSSEVPREFLWALDSAFAKVHAEARAFFGADADTMLTGISLAVIRGRRSADSNTANEDTFLTLRESGVLGWGTSRARVTDRDPIPFEGRFDSWFGRMAHRQLPPALRQWANGGLPLRYSGDARLAEAYRRLALFPGQAGRMCIRGTLSACRASLGIVPERDTLQAWFTTDERRELVLTALRWYEQSYWYQRNLANSAHGCVIERIDSVCVSTLRRRIMGNVESPTLNYTRSSFLHRALLRGGPVAFHQLVRSTSTDVGTLLDVASGGSIDPLIMEWRSDVIANQPAPPTPTGRELAGVAVLGIALLGLTVRRRP